MDDIQLDPVLQNPVDSVEGGLSQSEFVKQSSEIREPQITPAPVAEVNTTPFPTPEQVASISAQADHDIQTADTELAQRAYISAEQEALETQELLQKEPTLRMFSGLVEKAKDKHVGKYAAAIALGFLPAIAESKFGIHGLRETVLAVAPGSVFGGALGAVHEPVTPLVNKFTDVENLTPVKKAALKGANVAAGVFGGTATGFVGNTAAEHIQAGGFGGGFRMVDEYIPSVTIAAFKGIKSAIKNSFPH